MIKCENLHIGYGSRAIQHDLSFVLNDGELVALLGANGCGKSTLLRTSPVCNHLLAAPIVPNRTRKPLPSCSPNA